MSNLLPASAEASRVVSTPALELERLGRYLESRASGFRGLRNAERLMGGNSNPIWRLEADSGLYILRTQPAGELLKSAHALDRDGGSSMVTLIRFLTKAESPQVFGP